MTNALQFRYITRTAVSLLTALAVAAATLLVSGTPAPAAAQPIGTLSLMAQSPFVPSEGTFRAIVGWSGDFDPDLTLGGVIYNPIADESEITEPPGIPFAPLPYVNASSLERTPEGHLVLDIAIRSVEGGPERIRLNEAGVYPIQIDLRSPDGATLASLRTNLIRLPTEAAEIDVLAVSTVLEISSAEGLTVGLAAELLTDYPELPLTVVIGDGVLTQLENNEVLAADLRNALNGRPVVTAPTPELDVSALASIGRSDIYATARATTFERLTNVGLTPSPDTAIIDGNLTTVGIDLLVRLGVEVIIDTGNNSSRASGVLEGTNGSIRVVQVDTNLTSSMRGPNRSVERVHRLLAALSMRAATDRSPIFLGGSALRSVPLTSIQLFLNALQQPGTLGTVDLVDAANALPLFPILPDEQPTQNLQAIEELIQSASTDIATYRTFYVNGGVPPAVFERSLVEALVAGRNPTDRTRALEQLVTSLDERFGTIVLPEGQSVTLAAQRAEIPLTVENTSDGDRTVMLLFDSDKIDVTQDQTTVVLPSGVSTVNVETESRSLGRSPLRIRIMTPDRTVLLAETSYGVRSTAVPGLGLLLSATALLFLMVWWVRSITATRALRKHPTNVEPEAVAEAQSGS